jgi:hypothetical protein
MASNGIVGIWRSTGETNPKGTTLELRSDGTFILNGGNISEDDKGQITKLSSIVEAGTYTKKGKTLTLDADTFVVKDANGSGIPVQSDITNEGSSDGLSRADFCYNQDGFRNCNIKHLSATISFKNNGELQLINPTSFSGVLTFKK